MLLISYCMYNNYVCTRQDKGNATDVFSYQCKAQVLWRMKLIMKTVLNQNSGMEREK